MYLQNNDGQVQQKKILIIEDERALSEALTGKLRTAGFEVAQVYDGVEGLRLALLSHPDLIILDLGLPSLDGMSLLDELRKDTWGSQVHVIILTNHDATEESLKKVIEDHPSFYLLKVNISLDQVLEKVREIFEPLAV